MLKDSLYFSLFVNNNLSEINFRKLFSYIPELRCFEFHKEKNTVGGFLPIDIVCFFHRIGKGKKYIRYRGQRNQYHKSFRV